MENFDCNTAEEFADFELGTDTDRVFNWNSMASEESRYFSNDRSSSIAELVNYLRGGEMMIDNVSVDDVTMPRTPIQPGQIYIQDRDGDTKLHTAIVLKETVLAIQFIDAAKTPDVLSMFNNLRQTPLHLAVLWGDIRVIRRLVVGGADLMAQDRRGDTPVHLACRQSLEMVNVLLTPVGTMETLNNNYICRNQNGGICLEIVNYDDRFTPLHVAASHGDIQITQLLIQKGANVNAKEGLAGKTILHKACENGDINLVRYLIQLNACDVNARTYADDTPFDCARYRNHEEITTQLARVGALADTEGEDQQHLE